MGWWIDCCRFWDVDGIWPCSQFDLDDGRCSAQFCLVLCVYAPGDHFLWVLPFENWRAHELRSID